MFEYSITFQGKDGILRLEADSEDSPSSKKVLNVSKTLTAILEKRVNFKKSPNEIFERIQQIPSCSISKVEQKIEPVKAASVFTAPSEPSVEEVEETEEEVLKPAKQGWYDTPSEVLDNSETEDQ